MCSLDRISWEILNATADDWENLEQIYRGISFDFSPDNYEDRANGAYYWREAKEYVSLEEIADRLSKLLTAGLLEVRLADSLSPISDLNDKSYVWRGWFSMTPPGRSAWASTEYGNLVEQEEPR